MFEIKGIRRKIALLISRITPLYHKGGEVVMDLYSVLKSPRSVLVCLPFSPAEFQAARQILDKLVERFLFSELTFLVSHDFRGWLENRGNFNIITLTPKQANCFQLPRRKLLNSLKIKMFEVAIDLNPQDTLFSSILCLASGAKVRVGFNGEDSDNYFNFQVLPQRSEDPRGKYSALLNYLQ